jgi:predicted homoserine dehydrogenase-like protein
VSVLLRALEERRAAGEPIRVALVGAGFAGRGFALRVLTGAPWLRLAVVVNRTIEEAERAYREAGVDDVVRVSSPAELERAMAAGRAAVSDDPTVATGSGPIEAST